MSALGWGLFWTACAGVALGFEPLMTRARPRDVVSIKAAIEAAGMRYIGHHHIRGHRRLMRQPSGKLARFVVADVITANGSAAQAELILDPGSDSNFRISRVNKVPA